MSEKVYPKVGDQCYLRQFTGSYYVDLVKRPYTVIGVEKDHITVQSCKLIYPIFKSDPNWDEREKEYYKDMVGKRVGFYNTVAESIEPDPNGRVEGLTWHPKKGLWGTPGPDSDYPEYAIIGSYAHFPYLD